MRWLVVFGVSLSSLCFLDGLGVLCREAPAVHRSPMDLALLPGGQRALTANHTADTVSLVDLQAGKVLAEQRVGQKPSAVACARDGRRAVVSNLGSRSITLLEVHDKGVQVLGEVEVGSLPRGLAFTLDGSTLYVAVSGADEVVQVDWTTRKVTQRWPAPREPRELALSADGRHLAAASSRSGTVRCWDTTDQKLSWERTIIDGFNLRGLSFTPDGKDLVFAHALRREFPVSKHHIDQGWVIDNRLSKMTLAPQARPDYWQIALDVRGQAVGDPHGLTFSPDGRRLVVSASGTHELVIIDPGHVPWSPGEPGDFLDVSMEIGPHKIRRVDVGGRPLTVAFADGGRTVVVANYLLDAVQVVDVEAGKLVRSISLGAPEKPSLERKGESLFYDAMRSHHQWFSCHTCHVEGHTCCLKFDTLNDESYGNPKLTPTLHNVTKTGPWTWHGWQDDLSASIEKSLTETMFGPKPTRDDVRALLAFFATLTPPANPHRGPDGVLSAAAQRGKDIFHEKARCARCHKGELYTSTSNFDLKLEQDGSPFDLWNPPSLIGLWDRGPYLHDGRADSLHELLRIHHVPEKLGGQALTEQERKDLVEFLRSL